MKDNYKEKYEKLLRNCKDFKEVVIETLENYKGDELSDYDMGYNTAIEYAIAVVADTIMFSEDEDDAQPFLITRLEYELLKYWGKEYKYIARDRDLVLYVYRDEPSKGEDIWQTLYGHAKRQEDFDDLFKFVEWTDKEAMSIEKLLNECEVVDND